jgi:DNA-binding PadR family transcriptional regulator
MRDVTELEGCVLGLVWEQGPCTAYALRREFLTSPSPQWSGSAGAIYPLVARLERQGLIRSIEQATGKRRGKGYLLTKSGFDHFARWLGPPLSPQTIGVPMDPLRTRVRFLEALPLAERESFLQEAEAMLRAEIVDAEKDNATTGFREKWYDKLTGRGVVTILRARLAWIREVARAGAPEGS